MAQQAQDPNNYQHGRAAVPPWHGRLGAGRKAAVLAGGGVLVVVLLCCGGLAVVGALAGDPQQGKPASDEQPVAQPAPSETAAATDDAAPPTETAPPTTPAVLTKTVTETRTIPFSTRTVKDSGLAKGTTRVRTGGVAGVKTLTYEVIYTDGVETGRKLIRTTVSRKPVTKVVAVGTKSSGPRCDPNYSGGCVPIASDVDCAGGSGNGPAYVSGIVKVIGSDIYDLDRDNDGYGCD